MTQMITRERACAIVRASSDARYLVSAVDILWRLHLWCGRPTPARNTWYRIWPVENKNVASHVHEKNIYNIL